MKEKIDDQFAKLDKEGHRFEKHNRGPKKRFEFIIKVTKRFNIIRSQFSKIASQKGPLKKEVIINNKRSGESH